MTTDPLSQKVQDAEDRLAENGRFQFRQLSALCRGALQKIDRLDNNVGDRIGAIRSAIEALRASLEKQDFRSAS